MAVSMSLRFKSIYFGFISGFLRRFIKSDPGCRIRLHDSDMAAPVRAKSITYFVKNFLKSFK